MDIHATTNQPQDFRKLGYVGSLNPVDRNDWYTPDKYIEAAREVLGGVIEFDPYSDNNANQTVMALQIRTKWSQQGELWPVVKTVWMNPPFGRGVIEAAVDQWIKNYWRSSFDGIVLVNNATETRWFQALLNNAHALCLTDHRIAFNQQDGKAVSGNTRGQAFFYFEGPNREECKQRFMQVFRRFGFTVELMGDM